MSYLKAMFTGPIISETAVYDIIRSVLFLVVLTIASTPLPKKIYSKLCDKKGFKAVRLALPVIVFIICVAYLVDSSYNPFLYFRF